MFALTMIGILLALAGLTGGHESEIILKGFASEPRVSERRVVSLKFRGKEMRRADERPVEEIELTLSNGEDIVLALTESEELRSHGICGSRHVGAHDVMVTGCEGKDRAITIGGYGAWHYEASSATFRRLDENDMLKGCESDMPPSNDESVITMARAKEDMISKGEATLEDGEFRLTSKATINLAHPDAFDMEIRYYYDRTLLDKFGGDHSRAKAFVREMNEHGKVFMRHESLGMPVFLQLKAEPVFMDERMHSGSRSMLEDFMRWLQRRNLCSDASVAFHHLITDDNQTDGFAGRAWIEQVCEAQFECLNTGITERQFSAAATAGVLAHELGHNLGGKHGSAERRRGCRGIVASSEMDVFWSDCSRDSWEATYEAFVRGRGQSRADTCFRPAAATNTFEVFGECTPCVGTDCPGGGWLGRGMSLESCAIRCPKGFVHATHGDKNCKCLHGIPREANCNRDEQFGTCTYTPPAPERKAVTMSPTSSPVTSSPTSTPPDSLCNRPSQGCNAANDRYTRTDCDGDGILDHVCTNGGNRWTALSSSGNCGSWTPDNGSCVGECRTPGQGCDAANDVYTRTDCDGDGILDHVCTNGGNRWVALSSKGNCGTWVPAPGEECVAPSELFNVFGVCSFSVGTDCPGGPWLGKGTSLDRCAQLCPNGFVRATFGDHNCKCLEGTPTEASCSRDEKHGTCTYKRKFPVPSSPRPTPVNLGGTNDASARNLEACIGECDSDIQCRPGLKCFQRTGFTPVPGCFGMGKEDWDYCYDPTGSIELGGSNDDGATNLRTCSGECDSDAQCASGLKCFQRDDGETIPGCTGQGGGPDWDYCYDPNSQSPVALGGTNDSNARNLEACIGECDSDDQCRPGLKCFQRTGFCDVPGCSGRGSEDWDYCYDPTGSVELSGPNDNGATNLQACTGECDSDAQCASGLKCFQRDDGETIPGCTGQGGGPDWDYCYDPNWQSQGSAQRRFELIPPIKAEPSVTIAFGRLSM